MAEVSVSGQATRTMGQTTQPFSLYRRHTVEVLDSIRPELQVMSARMHFFPDSGKVRLRVLTARGWTVLVLMMINKQGNSRMLPSELSIAYSGRPGCSGLNEEWNFEPTQASGAGS